MICPLPRYWMCHIAVALVVALAAWPFVGLAGGLFGGAMIYVGRELTQKEQGGGPGLPLDWWGLLAPVVVCLALIVAIKVLA